MDHSRFESGPFLYADVMELVDVADSKSAASDSVGVRFPSSAPAQLAIRVPCKAEHA